MKIIFLGFVAALLSCLSPPQGLCGEQGQEERFFVPVKGVVLDKESGLMWAAADNGADINWSDSLTYSQVYDAGGYTDWRLPTLDELAGLYEKEEKETGEYGITPKIKLTSCCVWSSDESLRSFAIFSYRTGNKPWGFQEDTKDLRVLPVRDDRSDSIKNHP